MNDNVDLAKEVDADGVRLGQSDRYPFEARQILGPDKMIMKKTKLPCIVTIASTDPSGGAGIQTDIKTISATGDYAASVITAYEMLFYNHHLLQGNCALCV